MNNKWVITAVFIVVVVLAWNLLDYFVAPILFGDAYQFKVLGDLVLPIIVGAAIGYPYAKNRDNKG